MDDIVIKKILHDDNLIEISIIAESELVKARQTCYIDSVNLPYYSAVMQEYVTGVENECYVQFGEMSGNYTPSFSMKIIRKDRCGHVKVEVDIEIEDNRDRLHRCCFYVNSDIGAIERFGRRIENLRDAAIGTVISLNNYYLDE